MILKGCSFSKSTTSCVPSPSFHHPYNLWEWYSYLHERLKFRVNVDKHTSPMDPIRSPFVRICFFFRTFSNKGGHLTTKTLPGDSSTPQPVERRGTIVFDVSNPKFTDSSEVMLQTSRVWREV